MKILHRTILAALPVTLVTTMAWFGVFQFVNAYVTRGLGYSDEQWTATSLWLTGGMIFWQLICTEISSRIGRRRTVCAAHVTVAIAYVALAFTGDLRVIRAALGMMGFATAATAVAWVPLVAEAGGDRPGRAIAASTLVGSLVGAVTIVAGGYMIAGEDYRAMFLLMAAACAVCAVVFSVLARPLEGGAPSKVVSLRQVSRRDLAALVRGPFLMVMALGFCMEPFNFHTTNQLFRNLAAAAPFGLGEGQIGAIVGLGRIPALLTLFVMARFIDRISAVRCYGAGTMGVALAVIAMGMSGTTRALGTGFFAFYLFHGIVWASNNAAVNSCVPARMRDSAFAIANVIMTGCIFSVGVVHNRLLAAGMGLDRVFVTCGVIACVGGAALAAYSLLARSQRTPARSLTPPCRTP